MQMTEQHHNPVGRSRLLHRTVTGLRSLHHGEAAPTADVHDETGHFAVSLSGLIAAVGAILLMFGILNDSDALTIAGGIVLAIGVFVIPQAEHLRVDWEFYRRIDALEKRDRNDGPRNE